MAEEAGPAEWVAAGKEEEPDFPAADVAVADAGGAGARRVSQNSRVIANGWSPDRLRSYLPYGI